MASAITSMASVGTIGCNGDRARTFALGCGTQCGHFRTLDTVRYIAHNQKDSPTAEFAGRGAHLAENAECPFT